MKNPKQKPKSNLPNWFHTGFSAFLMLVLGGIGILLLVVFISNLGETTKKETPAELAKKEQDKLNNWFNNYSQYSCEDDVKNKLRNPSSYERDGDFIITDNTGLKKAVSWKFRAENGFGGMNVSAAICVVKKQNYGNITTTIIDG